MTRPGKGSRRFGVSRRFGAQEGQKRAQRRWREAGYSDEIIESLRWDRRYSIVWIGESGFAFSDYDGYVAALSEAWDAGLVPTHGPSFVLGIDLPDVVASLRGVDIDLTAQDSPGLSPETG